MKTDDFQQIFISAFDDPEPWRRWFFDNVATDPDNIYIGVDERQRAAGALLLQPYDFLFHGSVLPSMYMSCVGTRPDSRSHGVASRLIVEALADARARGYAFCELIPAQEHLFYFYARQQFATTFYVDRRRFTAFHRFDGGAGEAVEPTYGMFSRLERNLGCGVLHSESDYANVLADMALEPGSHVLAARDADGNEAMLFAVRTESAIKVKSILADTPEVAQTALAQLRRKVGEKPITVGGPAVSGKKAFLRPYGMCRILDVAAVLGALEAANPHLNATFSISDPIIRENNGLFTLGSGGEALEISIGTLSSLLFSSNTIGNIFALPTRRPYMSLMLD